MLCSARLQLTGQDEDKPWGADEQKRERQKMRDRGRMGGQEERHGKVTHEQEPRAFFSQPPIGSGAHGIGYTTVLLHHACHHCCYKPLDDSSHGALKANHQFNAANMSKSYGGITVKCLCVLVCNWGSVLVGL